MALFIDALVITDGTTPKTYNKTVAVMQGKSLVTTWKEDAADNSINSKVVSKYDASSPTRMRSVAQLSKNLVINDGVTLEPYIINISVNHHVEHDLDDLEQAGLYVADMIDETNFWQKLFSQG